MKKNFVLLFLAFIALCVVPARADIVIDGAAYHADTLVHRQVGPGIINTIVRFLNIFFRHDYLRIRNIVF